MNIYSEVIKSISYFRTHLPNRNLTDKGEDTDKNNYLCESHCINPEESHRNHLTMVQNTYLHIFFVFKMGPVGKYKEICI